MYEREGSIVVCRGLSRRVWEVVGHPSPLLVKGVEALDFLKVCDLVCECIVIGSNDEEEEWWNDEDEDGEDCEADVLACEARSIFTRCALDLAD